MVTRYASYRTHSTTTYILKAVLQRTRTEIAFRQSAIGSLVAGGGGNGMEVIQNPTNIEYFLPPSQSTVICGYVDGQLSTCIEQQ